MPGLSSLFTSRHSSSRCGFAGGPSRRADEHPEHEVRPQLAQGEVAGPEHGAGVVLGLGPAALQQPQPRPHPELVRGADRGVALLADAQRLGDRLLRLGEAPLLDVVVAEVAHRRRRQVVEPVPQADVGGREQVGPPAQVALEQPRHRDPDGRGAAQHGVVAQLVGDPRGPVARPSRLRGVAAPRREEGVPGQGEAERPPVVGGREDLDGGLGRAARRGRGRPRTRRSRRARCAPAPTATTSPSPRRSSSARSRAAMASRSRSVRYRSTDMASSRPARVAASSPTWRSAVS